MTRSSQKQRTALLTGATGGIGQALALRLAQDGLRLILTDAKSCDDFIKSAGLSSAVCFTAPCDLSSEEEVDRFTQDIQKHAKIDVLINNAAYMTIRSLDVLTPKELAVFQRINVGAPFQLSKAASVHMREQGWGRIINIVSGSAWAPPPHFIGYITSKMGLVGLTRSLAVELGSFGICVNGITPALTRHAGNRNNLPDELWEATKNRQAIKRTGTPEDLAGAISFLVSDDAAFMTGQTIAVDGGLVFL